MQRTWSQRPSSAVTVSMIIITNGLDLACIVSVPTDKKTAGLQDAASTGGDPLRSLNELTFFSPKYVCFVHITPYTLRDQLKDAICHAAGTIKSRKITKHNQCDKKSHDRASWSIQIHKEKS